MPTNLKGWHAGEREIQHKLHYDGAVAMAWTGISSGLSHQHREFHTSHLPFVPVTTLDDQGRPWGSIFAGTGGEIGFVKSPDDYTLVMDLDLWNGEPFLENSKLWKEGERMLLAGIGIEFPTRRRNKFAGQVKDLGVNGKKFRVSVDIAQALGNCPKYINVRDLVPRPTTSPTVVFDNLKLSEDCRLPEEIISFVHEADTVFLGTSYHAPPDKEKDFPSHLGMNQRGGLPGFIRVRPSDGRTLVLPDFSGNRMMTSLGNIEITPLASLTFVSFATGDIVYLTGEAKTLVGAEAQALMHRQSVLTTVRVTGYKLVRDALPVRQRPGVPVGRSPYSPPVKLLAEERPSATTKYFSNANAVFTKIEILSRDLATFVFEVQDPIEIKPGQAVALDFTEFVGPTQYSHMAPWNPASINDDRIRTWTVSSSHTKGPTRTFALTMRQKPGGLVTEALFNVARKLQESMPDLLENTRPLAMSARVVGISGDFLLPSTTSTKLVFIAGGIGVTPFLSMLEAVSSARGFFEVFFILSTREPEILLPLVSKALGTHSKVALTLDVFSPKPIPDFRVDSNVKFQKHEERLSAAFLSEFVGMKDTEVYLCGPDEFQRSVESAFGEEKARIRKEGFNY